MSLMPQEGSNFWTNLARTLTGNQAMGPIIPAYQQAQQQAAPPAASVPPSTGVGPYLASGPAAPGGAPAAPVKEPGFLGKALQGWQALHQNPEAAQALRDMGLGLMMSNTGNPFTDLGQGVKYSQTSAQGRRDQDQAQKDKEADRELKKQQADTYRMQTEIARENNIRNNEMKMQVEQLKADVSMRNKEAALANARQIAQWRIEESQRRGNLQIPTMDKIMYMELVGAGMDPYEAAASVNEYMMAGRAYAGAAYATPPSPIDDAISQDVRGTPAPRRADIPPGEVRGKIKEGRPTKPSRYTEGKMLLHKTQKGVNGRPIQYQVVGKTEDGRIIIKGAGGEAPYTEEALNEAFSIKP